MNQSPDSVLSASVARELPYLRRYARALTGSQSSGDSYAIAAIEAILEDPSLVSVAANARVGLFRVFHRVWESVDAPVAEPDSRLSARAQEHLAQLTPNSREALLLHTIEGFSFAELAAILGSSETEVSQLVDRAFIEMASSILGKVMIIEDEAIIAMDIAAIVEDMGHQVVGIARTHQDAVEMARRHNPDLILADIHLADNSSGIEAVKQILNGDDDLPVIFITAYPERLLTGERPEPAFLINKPYTEEQIRSGVSQAMFFSSTEPLSD